MLVNRHVITFRFNALDTAYWPRLITLRRVSSWLPRRWVKSKPMRQAIDNFRHFHVQLVPLDGYIDRSVSQHWRERATAGARP